MEAAMKEKKIRKNIEKKKEQITNQKERKKKQRKT
jgi:hypothetical protein